MLIIYSKPRCTNCEILKNTLKRSGVDYVEKDVTDQTVKAELLELLPSARSVPQIFEDNEYVGTSATDLWYK